ncbi:MAG TPA: SAF domain-containing protein [Ilumatobacteraceae bacterium]
MPELMLGILLVAGCALAAVVWQRSASTTQQALVFARDVRRGDVLTPQDFRAADVRATGARLLPYADAARLVGRVVVADISAFTPVTDDLAVEAIQLGADESLVGRRLELGEFPLGLQSGDRVTVVVVEDDPLGASAVTPTGAPVPEAVPAEAAGDQAAEAGEPASDPVIIVEPALELTALIETISTIEGGPGDVVVTLRVASPVAEQIAAAREVRLAQVAA